MNAIELLAVRALQISAGGHFDAENTEAVPSPCISVCRLDETSGRCVGCHRTLAEIGAWSRLDDAAKRQVWQAIEQRQAG